MFPLSATLKQYLSSSFALIIANFVPLVGVLYFGWSTTDILFIYWFESLIIGIFNVLKMLFTNIFGQEGQPPHLNLIARIILFPVKCFMIIFFIFHYGGFMFVHGIFLLSLFAHVPESAFQSPAHALPFVIALALKLKIAILSLFLSHGISFIRNFIFRHEGKENSEGDFMFGPYKRVIVMHLTIIFCAGITMFSGNNIFALIGLITIKTIVDLREHLKERQRFTSP